MKRRSERDPFEVNEEDTHVILDDRYYVSWTWILLLVFVLGLLIGGVAF